MIDISISKGVGVLLVEDYSPLTRHDHTFARDLQQAIVEISDDDEVKVVILRARGADFAPTPRDQGEPRADARWRKDFAGATSIYQAVRFSKKVIITEVQGECAGGGAMLVLCSDLTLAAEGSRFGSPFGALPESNFVLAALTMRLNRAKAWALTGEVLPADRAEQIGLVNEVVQAAELRTRGEDLARAAGRMPLDGITMSKMLLQAVLDAHGVGREFDMATHYAAHLWGTNPSLEEK